MNINRSLTFDDVLLVPNYNGVESRKEVSLATNLGQFEFGIPIISANMDTITGPEMATAIANLGGFGILHRFCTIEQAVSDYKFVGLHCDAAVSVGVGGEEHLRVAKLWDAGARIFCVDIAHGHSQAAGRMVEFLRGVPGVFIIAGNVATREGAEYLVTKGADVVKVGIGAGSVCTTREKTGFGVPQLSAIMDCAKIGVPIIADGGMRKPADVVKALAAGATMVMLGGMLAGTDETPRDGVYRGMASQAAQEEFFGNNGSEYKTNEGVSVSVNPKGPVDNIIKDICGGLRSALTYAGARNIKDFQRKATFIEVSQAVAQEGTAHFG